MPTDQVLGYDYRIVGSSEQHKRQQLTFWLGYPIAKSVGIGQTSVANSNLITGSCIIGWPYPSLLNGEI